MLCAFAVLFAHSITPHHHHEEADRLQHNHHHDNDHEDTDKSFLGHAFSHFQHEQGSGIVYHTSSPFYQYSKVNVYKDIYFLCQYIVQVLHKLPLKHPESYPFNFSSSSYSFTSLLRGPPVALA